MILSIELLYLERHRGVFGLGLLGFGLDFEWPRHLFYVGHDITGWSLEIFWVLIL